MGRRHRDRSHTLSLLIDRLPFLICGSWLVIHRRRRRLFAVDRDRYLLSVLTHDDDDDDTFSLILPQSRIILQITHLRKQKWGEAIRYLFRYPLNIGACRERYHPSSRLVPTTTTTGELKEEEIKKKNQSRYKFVTLPFKDRLDFSPTTTYEDDDEEECHSRNRSISFFLFFFFYLLVTFFKIYKSQINLIILKNK